MGRLGRKLKNGLKKFGSRVKGAAKKTGKGIKKAAKTTGSGIKTAAKKTGKGVKSAAKRSGQRVKKAGTKIKRTAKKTGAVTKKAARKVGSEIKSAAKVTGNAIKKTARKALKLTDFELKIRFVIGHTPAEFSDLAVKRWIRQRVRLAEDVFDTTPALKIKYDFVRRVKVNGERIVEKEFSRGVDYSRFMNKHFDNSARGIVNGHLVMLVVDRWRVSTKRFRREDVRGFCGKAFFPHYPGWRKHGVLLQRGCEAGTFVHELGHVFGLKHTFEKGGICTRSYAKGESGKGKTRRNGKINVMDYERGLLPVCLNNCQKKAAAFARRRYMLPGGKVNYVKLKGLV